MAGTHGKDARVYIQGYDLSSLLTSVAPDMSTDVAEISGLGSTDKSYVAGQNDATLALDGIFDGAANQTDEVLEAALGVSPCVVCWLPQGDGFGKTVYGFSAIETAYGPTTSIDDAGKFTAAMQSSVSAERGVILHALGAEVTTGDGTAHDNGAATTAGGAAYLQATAATGATVIKVRDSADNVTFADLVTFTSFAARTKERVAISGTIRRYTRENRATVPVGGSTYFTGLTRNN